VKHCKKTGKKGKFTLRNSIAFTKEMHETKE